MQIGIIGGGASGMTAAIAAKRADASATVFILEQKDIAGKKILSTGNGRCNLTNAYMEPDCFRSEHIAVVKAVLERFSTMETLAFFGSLGILVKARDGYYYPRTGQAVTVLDALHGELNRLGISVHVKQRVMGIETDEKGYRIIGQHQVFHADKVLIAAGGKAAAVLGSDGSGYALAQSVGHTLLQPVPALVQLKVTNHPFAQASGVRSEATVTALVDQKAVGSDTGELQLTAYGISGIPVFQISRYIAKALQMKKRPEVEIDFIPDMTVPEFYQLLEQRVTQHKHGSMEQLLAGIFHKKLIPALLKLAGIRAAQPASGMDQKQLTRLVSVCKESRVLIKDTNGFEHAQVCAGGIPLTQICPDTMESQISPGLYLTGELLDADGICGGYNLQWAWATGYLAGTHAALGKPYADTRNGQLNNG